MSGMRDMPEIVHILSSLTSPMLAILVGTLLTAVIQSSSVTVSIVLLMANQGLLELPICLFIILGCNIGRVYLRAAGIPERQEGCQEGCHDPFPVQCNRNGIDVYHT